jgi:hypothetical protein
MTEKTLTVAEETDELKRLGRLVGTWAVSDGVTGTTSFEWMEGGFFLIQRGDLRHGEDVIRMTELIGREHLFGAEPGTEIKSRVYDTAGHTLDYGYELEGDVLTIWGGFKGSPGYFRGEFDADGNRLTGDWVYPGGGYHATMVRI